MYYMQIQKVSIFVIGIILSLGSINPAYGKGCIKGAVIGSIAGHFMGHHALLGAAAGCAVVHHQESKRNKFNPVTNPYQNSYPNQKVTGPYRESGVKPAI
jgi:hypothetical protein